MKVSSTFYLLVGVFASLLTLSTVNALPAADQSINARDGHKPKIINVQVGGANIFAYTPSFVFADRGDTIRFEFRQANHTVTQSSFFSPCTALKGGANSGFVPNPKGTPGLFGFDFKVPGKGPFYFYCQQGTHCSKLGMVFEINPTVDRSFTEFFSRAKGLIH